MTIVSSPPVGAAPSRLSLLTERAVARLSPVSGRGLFATAPIPRGELVAFWAGHAITYAQYLALPDDVQQFPVQVWFDTFVGPTSTAEIEPCDFMNHSCEPTCGVRGSTAVVARRDIRKDEELTFDYGTTDTHPFRMTCHCGTATCRGVVSGDDWKDPAFRARHAGFLSLYIHEMIRQLT